MKQLIISVENCAAICHEASKAYNLYLRNDSSLTTWDEATEEEKMATRNSVRAVLMGMTPEQQHDAWRKEKRENGWKYAPTKNIQKKEHPSMLPYEKLPPQEQAKNVLFTAIVGVFIDEYISKKAAPAAEEIADQSLKSQSKVE